MANFIYSLSDPRTGEVRYIGKSKDPNGRLKAHLCTARNGVYRHYTANWINSLLRRGLAPALSLICEVAEGESWQEAEKQIIAEVRASGARLTNLTRGGDGLDNFSPEVQAAKSLAMKRHWKRPEYRDAIVSARNDPEFKRAQGDRMRRRAKELNRARWTEAKRREQAARISAMNRRPLDPEMVARRNASIKAAWARRKAESKE